MSGRLAIVLALFGVVALSSQAVAAPRPMVAPDLRGDTLRGMHGDLVELAVTTAGQLRRGGYTPHSLVVRVDLADDVDTSGTTLYQVDLVVPGCSGGLRLFSNPGSRSNHVSCHMMPSDVTIGLDRAPVIQGRRLTWTVPFSHLPDNVLAPGVTIRQIRAHTALADPVTGGAEIPRLGGRSLNNDDLSTSRTFTIR
jgi:hypothetical protein